MALPIHSIRDAIMRSLEKANCLVLSAPTGSGKTTQVPQFILGAAWRKKPDQIVVLQPRRLATRMVARRVANELEVKIGELVGYQTRHESRLGRQTIIRFMTEGLFLRIIQSNPKLDGIGAVILDEFHERNLATDTALGLVKLLQERERPDLRTIVMSATLDVARVSEFLRCPALETHGRAYPVDVRYYSRRVEMRIGAIARRPGQNAPNPWDLAAEALSQILDSGEGGDVLVFMPGVYEIRRTVDACRRLGGEDVAIVPLYSELSAAEQDQALAPCPVRKVIVSTNVAETSITIEGIRHVIDSGLARINRFDPRRGINVLRIEPISSASADQRAGRAGRTAAGTCTRLWPESQQRHCPAHTTPEVQRLDLAEVVLQLRSLGIDDVAAFPWLEPPPPQAIHEAQKTLAELGALDKQADGELALTETGRVMSRLPMHPRLSRMMVDAATRNCLSRASLWAALISEREILSGRKSGAWAANIPQEFPRSDFLVLEQALEAARKVGFDADRCADMGVNGTACRDVQRTQSLFLDACSAAGLRPASGKARDEMRALAECLLVAFPDHLAIRRSEANLACALVGGQRGQLDPQSVARHVGLLLPIEISEIGLAAGRNAKTVLSLVSEIDRLWLYDVHGRRIQHEIRTEFNADTLAVESMDCEVFEGLVVEEKPRPHIDPEIAAQLLADQVLAGKLKLARWDDAVERWIARVRWLAEIFPERRLITYNDDERRIVVQEICAGATRYGQIKDRPVLQHVKGALSWEDQQFIEKMAPERWPLPGGWRMRIEYAPGTPPRGRAKIQDLYGFNESPAVAAGRARVLIEILAPNMRPVQTTDDLGNFWKNLYPTLKRELARKYPKHKWR